MKNYSYEQAINIIVSEALNYDKELKNKDFMIIYFSNNKLEYKLLTFLATNYCHLTGAKINKISSIDFYDMCINRKLSKNDFQKPYGTMNLKLAALPYLSKIFFNHCSIGDYNSNGVWLRADYFIGNSKNVLSVGFRSKNKFDVPVTLYNQPIKELTNPTQKVELILRKNKEDLKFSEITYCNQKFKMELLNKCDFCSMFENLHFYEQNSSFNKKLPH